MRLPLTDWLRHPQRRRVLVRKYLVRGDGVVARLLYGGAAFGVLFVPILWADHVIGGRAGFGLLVATFLVDRYGGGKEGDRIEQKIAAPHAEFGGSIELVAEALAHSKKRTLPEEQAHRLVRDVLRQLVVYAGTALGIPSDQLRANVAVPWQENGSAVLRVWSYSASAGPERHTTLPIPADPQEALPGAPKAFS